MYINKWFTYYCLHLQLLKFKGITTLFQAALWERYAQPETQVFNYAITVPKLKFMLVR